MALTRLQLADFRCFESADLSLSGNRNLIQGANASGKTSLLEAFFYLSQGRSFRTAKPESLAREGGRGFMIAGQVSDSGGRQIPLGVKREAGRTQMRLNREPARRLADLTRTLPVLAVDSGVHRLIEEGPGRRRRYLDWGVFHVEQSFFDVWRRYQRALRQRNELLKQKAPDKLLAGWTEELAESGERLHQLRRHYFERLKLVAEAMASQVLGGHRVVLQLRPGWREPGLLDSLAASRDRDRILGATQVGPHRAEIRIELDGMLAQERASRGQQKGLATGLILAQAQLFRSLADQPASLLLDDLAAELDPTHLGRVLEVLDDLGGQQVFTAIGNETPLAPFRERVESVFHVEHGRVSAGG